MTMTIYPRPFPANSSRTVIPFLQGTICGSIKEQSVTPFETPGDRRCADLRHLIQIRITATTLPLADRRLIDADDPRELSLRNLEDARSDVFDGAHRHFDMPFGIISQYAERNLIYSKWHVC